MVIVAYVGKPGSGKTLAMSYSAINFYAQGWKIYSNYNLYNPITKVPISTRLETTGDLENAKSGRLEIDEIAAWLDARYSMSDQNAFVNSVLQKNRKRKLSLEWSAQDFFMADIRLRLNTDYVVLPEMFYIVNGQELHIKQSYFNPVNMEYLLPYAYLGCKMVTGFKYQSEKMLTERDVVESWVFKVQQIAESYDTSEEIKDLMSGEIKKGIEREKEALALLKEHFPSGQWVLNPASGLNMPNTFDIEGVIGDNLHIIDVCTLQENKDGNVYLNLRDKSTSKFEEVEKNRNATCYFMFRIDGEWYLLPSRHVKTEKTTFPISKVRHVLERIS